MELALTNLRGEASKAAGKAPLKLSEDGYSDAVVEAIRRLFDRELGSYRLPQEASTLTMVMPFTESRRALICN